MRIRTLDTKYKVGLLGAALFAAYGCGDEAQLDPESGDPASERAAPADESAQLRGRLTGSDSAGLCSGVRVDAPSTKRPTDIIFVVDNSGSMADEALAIQSNINNSFAAILDRAALDYRVVIVSRHGAYNGASSKALCITQPLSTHASCTPVPPRPGNNPPRFFHYSRQIESTDSLNRLLNTYDGLEKDEFGLALMGWSQWLCSDSFKVFIEITDDESGFSVMSFDTQLLAKTFKLFGDVMNRNYVFHIIGGFCENTPATKLYGPSEPFVTMLCTWGGGVVNLGRVYQALSILTGGLRFLICEYASFDAIFSSIATELAASNKVSCDFALLIVPSGEKIDPKSVSLEYSPGGTGSVVIFTQVANVSACAANSFYIDPKDHVIICPDACGVVQKDGKAKVQLVYSCLPITKPNGSSCAAGSECTSGFCADGFCCDSACGGGRDSDCQVCSKAKGAIADGTCSVAVAGAVCRQTAGTCDVAEVCDGVALSCPSNKLKPAGQVCRAASGPCDVAETCTGSSVSCPTNKYQSNLTICRTVTGPCDAAEFCSGTSSACPVDLFKPMIAVCRPAVGACDLVDYCTGGSPVCPPDDVLPSGTICRPQSSACDQQEVCSGASPACPFDRPLPDGSACPGGMCKAGICM